MASFEDVQEALIARLRATDIPNVFEVMVPPGLSLPRQNGAILPYVLISFGGQSPVAMKNQGIAGSARDIKWTSVACECIGNNPADVRQMTKIVRATFEGYIPDPGWGELTERLSGDYTVLAPDIDLQPIRFATGIVFNANTNGVTAN